MVGRLLLAAGNPPVLFKVIDQPLDATPQAVKDPIKRTRSALTPLSHIQSCGNYRSIGRQLGL